MRSREESFFRRQCQTGGSAFDDFAWCSHSTEERFRAQSFRIRL